MLVSAAHYAFAAQPPEETALARPPVAGPVEKKTNDRWLLGPLSVDAPAVAPFPSPAPSPLAAATAEGPEAPMVALTFDDGPWPGQTEHVLAVLAERNVPATFFLLGSQVERAPHLAQAIVAAGHAVGNHAYSHRRLDIAPADVVEWEIVHTANRIQEVTAVRPGWFRPPGGGFGASSYEWAARTGSRPALWTVDPQDWRDSTTAEEIAAIVLGAAHPGAVVVLHDGGGDQRQTIAALPAIIDGLRAAGYQFVTLDQLPGVKGAW